MQYSIIVRTRVSSLPLARVTIQRPEGHGSTCCDFTTPQLMAKKRVRVIFPGFEENRRITTVYQSYRLHLASSPAVSLP